MQKSFAATASVKLLQRLKFVGHPKNTERIWKPGSQEKANLDLKCFLFFLVSSIPDQIHFNSANFALTFSKLGSARASSLLSAYWMMPLRSIMNTARLGTPPIPRFICGTDER